MRFQHKLKLAKVTLYREKAGPEDGPVGMAISLSGGVKLQDLDALIACEHTVALLDHIYDAEGNLRTENIAALELLVCHSDVAVTIRAGGDKNFKGGTLDNITLVPKLSRVIDLTARLKVHPTEAQAGWLDMLMGNEAIVTLVSKKAVIGVDEEQAPLPLPDTGKKDKKGAKDKGATKH